MKAKRGMVALVTVLTRRYSAASKYAGEPAHEHYIGVVTGLTRAGEVKRVSVIGRSMTFEFPSKYGRERLVGVTDAVDLDAARPGIEARQDPGDASTWRPWESETEAVEYLRRFKR